MDKIHPGQGYDKHIIKDDDKSIQAQEVRIEATTAAIQAASSFKSSPVLIEGVVAPKTTTQKPPILQR